MCGRFVSASPPDEIARYFGAVRPTDVLIEPSYNVAPTDDVYAVLESDGVRHIEALHWGLVPGWATSPAVGSRMINARAETLATRNAFAPAFRRRRCIVPADGFYEWRPVPGRKQKQPMYAHRPDGEPLAFAGLWETWRDADQGSGPDPVVELLRSCTIITTAANAAMAEVHDRMPVILARSEWDVWLDEEMHDIERLGPLLVPSPSPLLLDSVSTRVNNVRNDGPDLIERIDPDAGTFEQGTLL